MRPLGFLGSVVFLLIVIGYPLAVLVDTDGLLFVLVGRVDDAHVSQAYVWTVIAVMILLVTAFLFGTLKNESAFLNKPIADWSQRTYLWFWITCALFSALISLRLFVSAGFSIPLLELFSNPAGYLLLRTEARQAVSQSLLNVNLLFFAPLSVCLALFFLKKHKKILVPISILNLALAASFSLAKSPIAMAFLVILIFYSCIRPIPVMRLARHGVVAILALIPLFLASESGRVSWAGDRGVLEIIGGRIVYGQWAGLPYFFDIFEKEKVSVGTLFPSYLRADSVDRWSYRGEESPARQAMRLVTGYRDLESAGVGVAVTFYIGEAYAVWGYVGVFLATVVVSLQLWLATRLLVYWPRNLLTMFLYSWFIYKTTVGLITGFSAFMFGSATYLLILVSLLTFASKMVQASRIEAEERTVRTSQLVIQDG